ncbi:MAG TPA: NfeD family protein [Bryobacteraceae bacterium]|nr:NfeD family protein [Bryobacteraceae bacterium]
MTWSDFYLVCFLVGFSLSALALLAGSVHLHLPHVHLHGGGLHIGGRGGFARGAMVRGGAAQKGGLSWFNFGTIAAFLAWFGGTGFLLERYYHVWVVIAMGAALASGLGASAVVFWFLARVLMANETALDAADYDMIGVLGRLNIPIREGGTGELIYSQQGTRRVAGARSETGIAIPKGAEVVVTRYEKGIAYVRPWEEMAGDDSYKQ